MTSTPPSDFDQLRRTTYDEAVARLDMDTVHDLIAQHGTQILDKGIPYLVVATRNRHRDAHRQAKSYPATRWDLTAATQTAGDSSYLETAMRDAQLNAVLDAIAALDDRDVLLLWSKARGDPDESVRDEFVRRGWDPAPVKLATIRKRRQRATARLRTGVRWPP